MLSELCIENLAVIKEAVIPFSKDFNVFTGETGAGKSVFINGINAVLGKRVSKDMVRSGCEKAVITALFSNLTDETRNVLDDLGIACEDDELLITREIHADGRSTARINSRTASVSALRDIGVTLIDVHGQHDNRILLYPEQHINIVDNFADLTENIEDYRATFRRLQEVSRSIKQLYMDEKYKQERLSSLQIMLKDISEADIVDADEDVKIENEFKVINNSYNIMESLSAAENIIVGSDDVSGALDMVKDSITELERYADIVEGLPDIVSRLENVRIETVDIADEISRIKDKIDIDGERMAYLEDRLNKLISIKKKYGPELSDVLEKYEDAALEAEQINNNAESIEFLKHEQDQLLKEVTEKAKALSEKRGAAAKLLSEKIENELRFLDMPNVKLYFSHERGKLTINGMDIMEIMISVNAGETPKPISRIASGGELSRIMLAIKNVVAEKEEIPTLIFDEIDTGVSGRAAQKIGIKLREISRYRQVLCVTHLSQIAIMADKHLLIEKAARDGRTYTTVSELDEERRIKEIARIICGDNASETALKNAKELLDTKVEVYNKMLKGETVE